MKKIVVKFKMESGNHSNGAELKSQTSRDLILNTN